MLANEQRTNDAAAAALAGAAGIYRYGDTLARLLPAGDGEPAAIFPMPKELTRDALAGAARFVKEVQTADGPMKKEVHPPGWCVGAVHTRGRWPGVPPLDGIAAGPVLRPDGTVLTSPGYDPETRLFVPEEALAGVPAVPSGPTADDLAAAVGDLLYVVQDFPFKDDSHLAAWFAAVLTPVARPAFRGPSPLFLLDANRSGAGKGLLGKVTVRLAAGIELETIGLGPDDAETDKRITAGLKKGPAVIFIDNIRTGGTLARPALERALTSERWQGRDLGTSNILTLPMRAVFYATGNNIAAGGDMPRRIVPVRLEYGGDNPEDRQTADFAEPDLAGYVAANRGRLLAAGLTILRAYFAAGRPEPPGGRRTLGSFEGWSGVVRDAIVWAGLADPLGSREAIAEAADDDGDVLAQLLEALEQADPAGNGMKAKDIIAAARNLGGTDLRDAVWELCDTPEHGEPTPKSLGQTAEAPS